MEAKMTKRIGKEIKMLTECITKKEITNVEVISTDNPRHVYLSIIGPDNTPYESGRFQFSVYFNSAYPHNPPLVKLNTKIYHPNIDELGRICLNILKSDWSPALHIKSVALSLIGLLESPNLEDPLDAKIAEHFKKNKAEAEELAKEITKITLL